MHNRLDTSALQGKLFFPFFVLLLTVSCSSKETADEVKIVEHSVTETDVMAASEENSFLGRPTRIIATGMGLYFSDHGFQQITRLNRDGEQEFSFGSQGEGPGEFNAPSRFWVFEDRYLVYDYNSFKFITYDRKGEVVEEIIIEKNPVNPDGFPPNIPLTVHAISTDELLIPSRGRNGSLFAKANIKTGDLQFIGEAVGNHADYDDVERAYSIGEIPPVFINMVSLGHSSTGIYSFQQTTGLLEKYSFSGELLWNKHIEIPAQTDLFDQISMRNQNIDSQKEPYNLFHYAWYMSVNEEGVAILLNMPEEEPITVAWLPESGEQLHLISYVDLGREVLSLFGSFSISPDNTRIYFLNTQEGIIYEADWPFGNDEMNSGEG